jgi:antitoxin YefM
MLTTTISDFTKDVNKYINDVSDNFETLIINNGNNHAVVMISLDEYNSIMATDHELSSKKNEKRLDDAIASLNAGNKIQKDLIIE